MADASRASPTWQMGAGADSARSPLECGPHLVRPNARLDVSIVIPTFRRETLLPVLIDRCFGQASVDDIAFEVIVVDNCPHRCAAPVVDQLRLRFGLSLRYVSETRPGVSHVRNAGVRAAAGKAIAFIDDDEVPSENWLAAMLACRRQFDADIVLGPVYPVFESPEATVDAVATRLFTQSSHQPTGTVVRPASPLSPLLRQPVCHRTMATNNALVDRSCCLSSPQPFAPALGQFGGEDILFFHNLFLSGRTIIWCREAAVFERVPPERLTTGYIVRRRYRNGQITSGTCTMTTPKQFGRLAIWMMVGAVQIVIGGAGMLLFACVSRRRAKSALCTLVGGAGKLLWMRAFRRRSYGIRAPALDPAAAK